jgi:biotin carboxyl carrier protein
MSGDETAGTLLHQLVQTSYGSVRVSAAEVRFVSQAGTAPRVTAVVVMAPLPVRDVVATVPGWFRPGVVVGDAVDEGGLLGVVATHGKEHAVVAPCAGIVDSRPSSQEEFVGYGTVLVRIAPTA